MKSWLKFGLLNAFAGLVVGGCLVAIAQGNGYQVFVFSAPMAAFLAGALFWKLIVKNRVDPGIGIIVVTGLLTGTVSHYFAFVLVSTVLNVCHSITGGCTGSLGEPPADVIYMLTGAFGFSFFSLIIFGWITAPVSVILGLVVRRCDAAKSLTAGP